MNNSIYKKPERNDIDRSDGSLSGFSQLSHIKRYLIVMNNRLKGFDLSKMGSRDKAQKNKWGIKLTHSKKEMMNKANKTNDNIKTSLN